MPGGFALLTSRISAGRNSSAPGSVPAAIRSPVRRPATMRVHLCTAQREGSNISYQPTTTAILPFTTARHNRDVARAVGRSALVEKSRHHMRVVQRQHKHADTIRRTSRPESFQHIPRFPRTFCSSEGLSFSNFRHVRCVACSYPHLTMHRSMSPGHLMRDIFSSCSSASDQVGSPSPWKHVTRCDPFRSR